MFIEAVVFGVIIGLVRNGSLRNISILKIRGWYLVLFAFLVQIFTVVLPDLSIVASHGKYFYVASATLIIVTLLINLNKKAMWIILIGALLNFIVVFINDFKMPIYIEGLKLAGMQHMVDGIVSGDITNYMPLDQVANWTKRLGKYIVIPKPYPMAKVISIGDIFMSFGIIFFVQGEMLKSYLTMKTRMVKMGYRSKF
jgi:hypothetical protein